MSDKIEKLRAFFGDGVTPKLMAIGDSVFNGVRSLSITADKAQWSPPAQMARAMGIRNFAVPQYPQPVLFDLEEAVRSFSIVNAKKFVAATAKAAIANAEIWDASTTWGSLAYHDNIAMAGARIEDLWDITPERFETGIRGAIDRAKNGDVAESLDPIYKLFFSINNAYVLNPMRAQAPCLRDASALDHVEARLPETLVVFIGSNNGLVRSAFLGRIDAPQILDDLGAIPYLMRILLRRLAGLDRAVKRIVVADLLRPSALAQLSPLSDDYAQYPGCGKYWERYYPKIALGRHPGYPAAEMAKFDDFIAGINRSIAAMVAEVNETSPRFHLVDAFDFARSLDGKHGCQPGGVSVRHKNGNQIKLDNKPFQVSVSGGVRMGGLFGLDNMHPTSVAYAALAARYMAAIGEDPKRVDVQGAYEADSLIQNASPKIAQAQFLVSLARFVSAFRSGD